jgi:tetratricopeptide (TPR) repeat protein
MNYPMNGEKGLDKALDLFKQAISCDSTNMVFYNNLANAYDKKHNYDGEMVALNKLIILTANDPAMLMQKGMLFEFTGDIDSAKNIYHLTQVEYENRLHKNPNDIELIKGIILLKAVTDGKDEAVKVLNKQIKTHPELSSQLSSELMFYKYFNRHDFVFRLPTVTNLDK